MADAQVSLVVVGDAGAPGRTASAVARGVEQTLRVERNAGREPVVLWLGDVLIDRRGKLDCGARAQLWSRRGTAQLAEVVREHRRGGGASFALPGEAAYRCGARASMREDTHPWSMPAVHYVVDVGPRGDTSVSTTCQAGTCAEGTPTGDAVASLVFIDTTPWIAGSRAAKSDGDLLAMRALLEQLRQRQGPPRILVTHYPVEAAGYHGQGGGDPDSTVQTMPPVLMDAVREGLFAGTIAAHDRASYVARDISDATIRSNRVFLERPVFEVVSGAASAPDVRTRSSWRRFRYNSSIALLPDRYTPRGGFAVVHLGERSTASLFAHRGGRWSSAQVPLELRPAAHPGLVRTPSVAPCLRCPTVPYSER